MMTQASNSRMLLLATLMVLVAALLTAGGCAPRTDADGLGGTRWRLVEWSVSSLDSQDFEITLSFDGDQLGGQAPVNSYGGSYLAGRQGAFSTSEIAQTLMAGSESAMQAESAYFELLAQAERWVLDGGRLVLSTRSGAELLIFERVP